MSVPSDADPNAVLASEAGALFAARARESGGDLVLDVRGAVAVHALCARLDGIPLALELAAAQTAMMTPAEIERRLDKQFRLASATIKYKFDFAVPLIAEFFPNGAFTIKYTTVMKNEPIFTEKRRT